MRSGPTLLVCLCVVLAGCGTTSTGGGARTVNPALADTPTASPTPEPWSGPPGVTQSSVDVRELASAHGQALANRSVTVELTTRRTWSNGTTLSAGTQRSYADGERQFYRWNASAVPYRIAGDRTADVAYWQNDTVAVRRWGLENGSAEYEVYDDRPLDGLAVRFDPTGEQTVLALLEPHDLSYDGTVTNGEETLYRLVATGSDRSTSSQRSDVNVRVLVTEAGIIRSIGVRYQITVNGQPVLVGVQFVVSDLSDTTVPRPPWVNETLANAD
ncbi:hypothetical protein Hbl1158_09360 [Halobaculum sp. CBA1158]|uniref:DUF7537 family lipoprotein n=1 Tax=Halobaculum sp. CBA1158 TaxID=2904243 RepID=UPI001F256C58|nr:hypothetical protein [Halobaculum sp. CBA1158]UIO98749.1 hypothetical protein Hbl1158_09360 [Halobaculum sp. CBA1158]